MCGQCVPATTRKKYSWLSLAGFFGPRRGKVPLANSTRKAPLRAAIGALRFSMITGRGWASVQTVPRCAVRSPPQSEHVPATCSPLEGARFTVWNIDFKLVIGKQDSEQAFDSSFLLRGSEGKPTPGRKS